ncbi:MAG TPA: glycosyltransferase family 39 protein [Steroidobacteraceae bacterium]|nr:glycosyltransferase family 39 protein [Steroidobacteraceae bacterium]
MTRRSEAIRSADGGLIPTAFAVGLVVYVTFLRLYFGAHVDLMPEETYYWNYSRHLDYGYLDHPPMVAWLIRGGTALLGNTALGVRIGSVLCALLASLFVYRLTRNLFGRASAALALALAQAMPFFFVQGLLMTPDAPLTAAWAGSLYFLERALVGGRARAWWWAGLCLGLGMLSKYTIGLLGLAALSYMIAAAQARPWLRRWEPYAAAALAFAIFSPVIVWNAEHHWASFAFQTARRFAGRPRFALPALIGASIVLITPTGLAAALRALAARSPAGGPDPAHRRAALRFLRFTVLVPMSVFVLFSLRRAVKLDWTGAPWIAALPLIAFELVDAGRGAASAARRALRATALPTVYALCLLYPVGLYHLAHGLPGVGYDRHMDLLPVGWRQLGRRIGRVAERYRRDHGAEPLVVGMDRYAIASELAFYGGGRPDPVADTTSGHLFGGMGLMYQRWFPADRQRGRTLLLVSLDRSSLDEPAVGARSLSLGPIRGGMLRRDGHVIRAYYYRFAYGYRGLERGD